MYLVLFLLALVLITLLKTIGLKTKENIQAGSTRYRFIYRRLFSNQDLASIRCPEFLFSEFHIRCFSYCNCSWITPGIVHYYPKDFAVVS